MLDFAFLSEKFYADHTDCPEIEQKEHRPYIMLQVEIDGVLFGIPLRSSINHPHVLWTDRKNRCGVDFSKAVVLSDPASDLDRRKKPHIRPNEFKELKGKEHIIQTKMRKYIADYKKAKAKPEIERNRQLLKYSTLQYFEIYI